MPWTRWLLLGASLAGCTFVTRAEYEAQLLQRDEDRDGYTIAAGDCDDRDPSVHPDRADVPYDGIDNDCASDGDLVDVDGDGFAAQQAGGDDCRDDDPEIRPGATDPPYDGVDTDCGADNDFDADRDQFMPGDIPPSEVAAYKAAWSATFPERYGDCDDLDPLAYPGAPGEVPYDGVDTDCDGANDFDADGDGVPFVEGSGGDCLDAPVFGINAKPEDVYPAWEGRPAAPDAPYDGVDSDCARDNDFDVDGDGFVLSGSFVAYLEYEERYGLELDAEPEDCNDDDARMYPGALEILGDALDHDCDRRDNGTDFVELGFSWSRPRAVRIRPIQDHLVLSLIADELDDGLNNLDNVVSAIVFPRAIQPGDAPVQTLTAVGPDPSEALDDGAAVVAQGAGFAVASVDARAGGRTLTVLQDVEYDGVDFVLGPASTRLHEGGAFGASAVDLVDTGTDRLVWSCGGSALQVSRGADLVTATAALGLSASTCFADRGGLSATACGSAGCETWAYDVAKGALLPATEAPWAGRSFTQVRRQGSLLAAIDSEDRAAVLDGLLEVDVPGGTRAFDAVEEGGDWFYGLIRSRSDRNDLRIGWGPAGGPLDTNTLRVLPTRGDLNPIDVAITAADDRVVLVVVLKDVDTPRADVVAWAAWEWR